MTKQQLNKMSFDDILAHEDMGWSIVCYERDNLNNLCKNILKNECAYAYIYHDKDKKETCVLKEPHFHLLLVFPFEKTGRQVYDMCKAAFNENVRLEPILNRRLQYEYLTHKNENDPLKWHYPVTDIVCNNKSIFTYQRHKIS